MAKLLNKKCLKFNLHEKISNLWNSANEIISFKPKEAKKFCTKHEELNQNLQHAFDS